MNGPACICGPVRTWDCAACNHAEAVRRARDATVAGLLVALRIHHDWSIRNMPGYSEHGDERVAYRATAQAIKRAEAA